MPNWRIYYGDGSVARGSSAKDWARCPGDDVQVIVAIEAPPTPRPDRFVTGYVECSALRPDRTFYTGVDEYDPFGYGIKKLGKLMPDAEYRAVWDKAYGDN